MDMLPTFVPIAGFVLVVTVTQTCYGAKLFGRVRRLETRVKQLEDQPTAPRIVVPPSAPAFYPPTRYAYPYAYPPPAPSAPQAPGPHLM